MHKLESVLENEEHEILLEFERQTNRLIQTRRPDLELNNKNKKNLSIGGNNNYVPADHRVKVKESEKIDKHKMRPKYLLQFKLLSVGASELTSRVNRSSI